MKYKVTVENEDPKKAAKKQKKAAKKNKKFSFKETVIGKKNAAKKATKKTKEEIKKLRIAAFANTRMLWRPYAMMIADYFNWEYYRNFNYIFYKLEKFNNKQKLTAKELKQLEVLVSVNELKYYVVDKDKPKTIDINDQLINRDFFVSNLGNEVYQELIEESDQRFQHSISYLFKLTNLLISFVKDKETKEIFYKTIVLKENEEMNEVHHPIVINEKIIGILPTKRWLSNKYNKKLRGKYEY